MIWNIPLILINIMRKKSLITLIKKDGTIVPSSNITDKVIYNHFQTNYKKRKKPKQLPPKKSWWKKVSNVIKDAIFFFDWDSFFQKATILVIIVFIIAISQKPLHNAKDIVVSLDNSKAVRVLTRQERKQSAEAAVLKETNHIDGIYDFSGSPTAHLIEEAGYDADCVKIYHDKTRYESSHSVHVAFNSKSPWFPNLCSKS